jgi:hypothetical protein
MTQPLRPVYIVSAVRTPIGSFQGFVELLSHWTMNIELESEELK